MYNRLTFLIFFVLCNALLFAQEGWDALFLHKDGLSIDVLEKTIDNKDITYEKKIELVYAYSYKKEAHRETEIRILNCILVESKGQKDANGMLFIYVHLADLHRSQDENDRFDLYMDSADVHMEDAVSPLPLARYHFMKGVQAINKPYGRKKGYRQFEKAITYFDRLENSTHAIEATLYNIAINAANTPDTAYSKRLIGLIERNLGKNDTPAIQFLLNSMKGDLYHEYFKTSGDEAMLDSAIHFEFERIHSYSRDAEKLPKGYDYDVLQSHLILADYYSQKQDPDWTVIDACIRQAESFGYPDDCFIKSRIKYTKSIAYFCKKNYSDAENSISEAEALLNADMQESAGAYSKESYYSNERSYAELHCKILMAQEKYREALAYNELKNELTVKLQDVEAREIEYLYNTEKEDIKIERLRIINQQQFKSNTMLVTAIFLFILLIILLRLWLKMINKNFKKRYELIYTEKREAEINLKISEERAIKSVLEKYEVLSDNRIKEIELKGKNREMEILVKEKEALDVEIEEFTERIQELDSKSGKPAEMTANTENQLLIDDLITFLEKKLPAKPEYTERLHHLNDKYIVSLKAAFQGTLSKSYIKYCLCFSIGVEISEIAESFEIEPSSVHVLRYRLKKRFGLDGSSLDDFLKNLK